MASYLLYHRHEAQECGATFVSFRSVQSALRRRPALSSCRSGGHEIWWTVEAESGQDALDQLPAFVADRTTVTQVSEVPIP